jgi:type IV pilus assembly protein PilY1
VALYAGDLQGNLWKIDLTGGSSTWTGTGPVMFSAMPLFTAKDSSGARQPITTRPALAKGPGNGTMVLFGTGQFLGNSDLNTTDQQSFYGIFDNGGMSTATQVGSRSTDLSVRTLTNTGGVVTATGSTFSFSSAVSAVPGSKGGWYVDFLNTATTGERSVSAAVVDSGIVTFSTVTLPADPCGSGGGFIYQMSALSGLALDLTNIVGSISNVGTPGPAQSVLLASISPKGTQTTGETVSKKEYGAIATGTSGDIKLADKRATIRLSKGRVGWREIPNWNGLAGH